MKTTNTTPATSETIASNLPATVPSSKLLDRIMKQRAATAVRVKTCGISDLFKVNQHSKKFNQDGIVTLPVTEISAKFIPKYSNDTNKGYLTSYTTDTGELFTSFSSASLRFFEEVLTGLTGQQLSDFSRLSFDSPMFITIEEDSFTAGIVNQSTGEINNESRKTYRFSIIGGSTEKIAYLDNNQLSGISEAVTIE
jgi:hypothetical protein